MPTHVPHLIIHPGWQDSGPTHWQSRWQAQLAGEASLRRATISSARLPTTIRDHAGSGIRRNALRLLRPTGFAAMSKRCDAGSSRVAQHDWHHPEVSAWVAALHAHVMALDGPLMLAAHSLGCITLARWAQQYPQHASRISAALLVAPADVERADAPHEIAGFAPIPLCPLPFPAAVVASDDDPYCTLPRSRHFAKHWQVPLHVLHGAGHINAESGLGDWPAGLQMLEDLLGDAAQRRSSFQEKCR